MKSLVFTIIYFLSFQFSFSQVSTIENIKAFYGEEWYDKELRENPQFINILNLYIEKGFRVIDVSPGKYNELTPLTEIKLTSKTNQTISIQQFLTAYESGNFNPLVYQFLPTNETQVFKLEGFDKIIYIESFSYLLNVD